MADKTDFVNGYLAACQNLVALHDQPSMAEDLLLHSGFGRQELLAAQRTSGFRSREMCPLIRAATEGRGSGAGTPVRAGEAV